MESDVITLQELFRFEVEGVSSDRTVVGNLVSTGLRPSFLDKFEKRGVKLPSWVAAPVQSANGPRRAREAAA
jgi:pilus assembly protein CpaF